MFLPVRSRTFSSSTSICLPNSSTISIAYSRCSSRRVLSSAFRMSSAQFLTLHSSSMVFFQHNGCPPLTEFMNCESLTLERFVISGSIPRFGFTSLCLLARSAIFTAAAYSSSCWILNIRELHSWSGKTHQNTCTQLICDPGVSEWSVEGWKTQTVGVFCSSKHSSRGMFVYAARRITRQVISVCSHMGITNFAAFLGSEATRLQSVNDDHTIAGHASTKSANPITSTCETGMSSMLLVCRSGRDKCFALQHCFN